MSIRSTHVHELSSQLEGRRLEAQVFRRAGQDEAKVDVDDVSLCVQQDVPVVPERTETETLKVPPLGEGWVWSRDSPVLDL